MTAQRTSFANSFQTTLSAEVGPNDLTFNVAAVTPLTSPCYIVFEMASDTQREYVEADGTFTGTTFVCTNIAKRYLSGSAAGSNLTHPIGTTVSFAVTKQALDDLHDRLDGINHASLGGLSNDDHPQYSLVDGTRAFTGKVVGVTPTTDLQLATKVYVDSQTVAAVPPGIITPYGAAAAPIGYLLCDGAEVSRATYSALYAITADLFGSGNGTTTFDLPDLRGRFPLGVAVAGTGSTIGDVGGTIDATIAIAHTHGLGSHTHDIGHGHADTISTASTGSHAHTMGTHTHSGPSHSHSTPAHQHPMQSHTHAGGNHTHFVSDTSSGPSTLASPAAAGSISHASSTHTHSISDTSSSNSGTTGGTVSLTDGAGNGTSGSGGTGATGSTDPGDTSNTGSHSHTVNGGVTALVGSSGSSGGTSDSSLSATQAIPNSPFLAVQYIIKT